MSLGLLKRHEDPFVVLVINGDLEMSSTPSFRQAIIETLADGDRHIIIDFGGTDFIDSTGLGGLIGALKRVRSLEGTLQIVCPQPRLQELFKLTDLHKVFALHESVDVIVERGLPLSQGGESTS